MTLCICNKYPYELLTKYACNFQQFDILTSVDTDEPVHPPFKLRNSKINDVQSVA